MTSRVLLVTLTGIALLASAANWLHRAYPAQHWRETLRAPQTSLDLCPDGMGRQIDAFAGFYQGDARARESLLELMRHSNQASTFLVGAVAGALRAAGMPAHFAFALLSAAASTWLVAMLWRTFQERALPPSLSLWGTVAILFHPAALRCLVRPQTDALVAAFLCAAWFMTERAVRRRLETTALLELALVMTLGTFVKIHTVSFALLPSLCGWLLGVRGKEWRRLLLFGTVFPLVVWCCVFAGLGLWASIPQAWETKETFYSSWDAGSVFRNLLPTVVPFVICALGCRRWPDRGLRGPLLAGGFYALILVGCGIPPLMRFVFPALAPLVLCTVGLVAARDDRWTRTLFGIATAAGLLMTAGLLFVVAFDRYLGPIRRLDPLASWLYPFF